MQHDHLTLWYSCSHMLGKQNLNLGSLDVVGTLQFCSTLHSRANFSFVEPSKESMTIPIQLLPCRGAVGSGLLRSLFPLVSFPQENV